MSKQLSVFRKFPTFEQAKELEDVLNENGIIAILADNIAPVDVTFSGSQIQNEYEIKISQSDFQKAEAVLEKEAETLLDQVDKDYYLFDFTTEELYEVLFKADEWSNFDNILAKKILLQRGEHIDQDKLEKSKEDRLTLLSKPEESQKLWIIIGYIFLLLGGIVGIIIGYSIWTTKMTLPNGEKVYSYNSNDRNHGRNIFWIGVITLPILFLLRILTQI